MPIIINSDNSVLDISSIRHPLYSYRQYSWRKWRLTYESGDEYINYYLQKYSKSESTEDFIARKLMTYVPSFAKAALIEVRNSIYQRLMDISRVGGSYSWSEAIEGRIGGVDMLGSSMNNFMGTKVLEELLVMGKVGIYVDMSPITPGLTTIQTKDIRPYLYIYKAEDILSWDEDDTASPNKFKALLLRETIYNRNKNPNVVGDIGYGNTNNINTNSILNLPCGEEYRYRYYWKDSIDGSIWVQFYDAKGSPINPIGHDGINQTNGEIEYTGPIKLNISKIPFVCLELNNSLLADIANYQIALLNLASTDIAYAIGANFPFYTEQFDPRWEATHLKTSTGAGTVSQSVDPDTGGVVLNESTNSVTPPNQTINVGPTSGRKYPKGTERPGFVHPSSDPLKASMEKQHQLQREIRLLINLTISDLQPKMASAESKGMDVRTLESGLSYIGLVMEDGERQVADIWHEYESPSNRINSNGRKSFLIKYPSKYSLRTEKDVFAEVQELKGHLPTVPSMTFKRIIAKRIAELLIGHRVTIETLNEIYSQIDNAEVVDILIDKIVDDVAGGFLDPELAAKLRGYPVSTVAKAQQYHIERLKEIQAAQMKVSASTNVDNKPNKINESASGSVAANPAARGIPDLSPNPTVQATMEKKTINQ